MKRYKFLMAALLLCVGNFCFAQHTGVIDNDLLLLMDDFADEKVSVNIVLKARPEPARMKAFTNKSLDKRAARELVVNELKEHSLENQAAVLGLLQNAMADGLVSDISCHWVANVITCKATKEVVAALATHPDVLLVGQDKEMQIVDSR